MIQVEKECDLLSTELRRCCIACAVAVVATLAVLGIALLVTWYVLFGRLDMVAAEAVKAGRIKERMIHLSV